MADTKRFFSKKKEKDKKSNDDEDKKKKPVSDAADDCPCDDEDDEGDTEESPKDKKSKKKTGKEKSDQSQDGEDYEDDEESSEADPDFSDDEDDVKQKPKNGAVDDDDEDHEDVDQEGNPVDKDGNPIDVDQEGEDGQNFASDPFSNPLAKSQNPFIDIHPVLYSDENDETGESENEDDPAVDPKQRGEKKTRKLGGTQEQDDDAEDEEDSAFVDQAVDSEDDGESEVPPKKKKKKSRDGESSNEDNPVKNRRGKKAPVTESVLSVAQRVERGRDTRRRKTTLGRARKVASARFASQSALKRRAQKQARQEMRARLAGKRGEHYASLSPSEKVSVDRILDSDAIQKSIKRLAVRLAPTVRRKENERLQHKRGHRHESFDDVMADLVRLLPPDFFEASHDRAISLMETYLQPMWDRLEIAENAARDYDTLETKALAYDIDPEAVMEVFERGIDDWIIEDTRLTPAQFAFNRVNSFLNGGRSYKESDKDLVEAIKIRFRDKE